MTDLICSLRTSLTALPPEHTLTAPSDSINSQIRFKDHIDAVRY